MIVRPYDHAQDYPYIQQWSVAHNPEDTDPAGVLSPFGGVVEDDDGPLLAGFAYLAKGCEVCFFDRVVGRPGSDPRQIREAGKYLLAFLRNLAVANGYSIAYAHIVRNGMVRELQGLGWTLAGEHKLMTKEL